MSFSLGLSSSSAKIRKGNIFKGYVNILENNLYFGELDRRIDQAHAHVEVTQLRVGGYLLSIKTQSWKKQLQSLSKAQE